MAEEWRVSIDFAGHRSPGLRRAYPRRQATQALRSRFGGSIAISAEDTRIYLYTEHAGVARRAELAAGRILARQRLSADVRLDRWDPSDQVWRNAQFDEPEQNAAPSAAGAGRPGRVPMSSEMVEALASILQGALDIISMIP